MNASEKSQPEPREPRFLARLPTLTERIAEELEYVYRMAGDSYEAAWDVVAARVEAFARAAALHARLQGGFDVALERPHFEDDDALLAALPALSTPPPEETR